LVVFGFAPDANLSEVQPFYAAALFQFRNLIWTGVIIHNFEDAQDVVQEAFLKAFQKLGDFRGDSKFSTWYFVSL
jgi:RNA polymerase sigma-70 factor (ECF subfamily)